MIKKSSTLKLKYLIFLFVAFIAMPASAQQQQPPLLQKLQDGSILITPQNAWAILRGRIAAYDNSYLSSERVAGLLWGDQLNGIVDQFEHHSALEKDVKLLDDASAASKSIENVTFVFNPAVGPYDFSGQVFPIIQAYGSDNTRMCPGATYVCFDKMLVTKLSVPETQAQSLAQAIHANGGSVEITVKGTIKVCRLTSAKEQGRIIGWQPKTAEEEPCDATMYKIVLSVHSAEYRLKNPGTILLTKTFDDPAALAPASATNAPSSP